MSIVGLNSNNKHENYYSTSNEDKEIEAIINEIGICSNKERNDILITPDSLETMSTVSDDADAASTSSTPSSSLICDNELINDNEASKQQQDHTTTTNSEDTLEATQSPVLVPSETIIDAPISIKNEAILEKIRKINKLQDKINDINLRIKLSNSQHQQNSKETSSSNNYYCIANQVDDLITNDETSDSNGNDLIDNETFFDYADQCCFEPQSNMSTTTTEMNNEVVDTYDYYFDDDDETNKLHENFEEYFINDNNNNLDTIHDSDDDDDDNDQNFKFCLKQAQPVHKKFASTGLLYYKIKYMDTIVEDEEISQDDESTNNNSDFKFRKNSTSCFNLTAKCDNNSSLEILINNNVSLNDANCVIVDKGSAISPFFIFYRMKYNTLLQFFTFFF